MESVRIFSRRQIEATKRDDGIGLCPLISITEPGQKDAKIDWHAGALLRVRFADDSNLPMGEIRSVYRFIRKVETEPMLLVHCEAGLARSAAVALFCSEYFHAEADLRGKHTNLAVVAALRRAAADEYMDERMG